MTQLLKTQSIVEVDFPGSLLELDQVVLDAVPMGIYACDANGLIRRFNRTAAELWGRAPRVYDPAQRFCGTYRLETFDGQPIAADQTPMARAVMHGESFRGVEAVVFNPDGRRWVARVNVEPLRDSNGTLIGAVNCFQDVTLEHELRAKDERRQRTFDLAMIASKMGTWRYTMADNICLYDDNAQALYGLTEGRFLHDEEGVKAKFHPDDMALMWERVGKAIDPTGDGLYAVEYRVKQLDGSWRWLSAWGLVEFEGEGASRKPVAIAGASRDLSQEKESDDVQKTLVQELDHRVKNTLTIVQSIAYHTLRGATDLESARKVLDGRILSLARAHDLLTKHRGIGAHVGDVVARALHPFASERVKQSGPTVQVSPRLALALSLALHELATNASKYGALSSSYGKVALEWQTDDGKLHVTWQESDGPAVTPPARKGFGSRLLDVSMRELDGETIVIFEPTGVRCDITAPL